MNTYIIIQLINIDINIKVVKLVLNRLQLNLWEHKHIAAYRNAHVILFLSHFASVRDSEYKSISFHPHTTFIVLVKMVQAYNTTKFTLSRAHF